MAQTILNELTKEMMEYLQGERIIFLSTVDYEKGIPNVTCISWLLVVSPNEIRFAIDPRSKVIKNIASNSSISLSFVGLESCFTIDGTGTSDGKQLDGVAIKMTNVVVKVKEVRDVMFYGSKVTQEPNYEKTYDVELAKKFDTSVYTALRNENSCTGN